MDNYTYILEKIRKLRDSRDWTEYRLSEESGIPQSTISSWFRHKAIPSIASLNSICEAFNITLSQFFYTNETYLELSPLQKELIISSQRLNDEQLQKLINFLSAL